eukprot:Hpha_TRINITY_DN20413_c0_g1::TRINITY_DN20413_c0_g1_i1::g.64235::m.64235
MRWAALGLLLEWIALVHAQDQFWWETGGGTCSSPSNPGTPAGRTAESKDECRDAINWLKTHTGGPNGETNFGPLGQSDPVLECSWTQDTAKNPTCCNAAGTPCITSPPACYSEFGNRQLFFNSGDSNHAACDTTYQCVCVMLPPPTPAPDTPA